MAQTTQTNLATPESVPIGWELSKVGSLVKRVNEKRGDIEPEPTILSCSKDHGLIPQLELFKRRVAALDTRRYKLVGNGDFVYDPNLLWSGAISRSRQQAVGIVSPVYEVFRVDHGSSQDFLHAWFMSPSRLPSYRAISMGTNVRRRRADFGDFCQLSILLPPLPEQHAIAAVLDSIDEAIERTKAVIAATERLRDALLHELLTRGVPGWHTEWMEVPGIGNIPADWEVVRLGDVSSLRKKQIKPAKDDSTPYVALEDLVSGGTLDGYGRAGDSVSNKTVFFRGDTLYGKLRPNLRKTIRAEFDGVCSTDILAVFAQNQVDSIFLSQILRSDHLHQHAMRGVAGTKMPRTSWPHLRRFDLALPSLVEQQTVAAVLDIVEVTLERARKAQDSLLSLKGSAADALLTGRMQIKGIGE